MSKAFPLTLLILAAVAVAVGMFNLPVFTDSTNCGGNSAALAAVGDYLGVALVGANDSSDGRFDVKAATAKQRRQISRLSGASWLRRAHFLVSTALFTPHSGELRRVLIVCDTPYTNVPQRRFFKSPPTHAAGFSDGTTGLISPKEFAALDRSTFVAIDVLFPKEKLTPEN
jgi:hypothetical protein